MSYTNKQEMIQRYGETELIELTDRDDLDAIDDAVLDRAIADAEAVINSYLQGRYEVPLSPTPDVLVICASDLARANLYKHEPTEHISNLKKEKIKFLELVSQGKINLGVSGGGETEAEDDSVMFETGGNVFDRKDNSFI